MGLAKEILRQAANHANPAEDLRVRRVYKNTPSCFGDRQVYLIHIRKTAGNSLIYSFLGLSGVDGETVFKGLAQKYNHRLIVNDQIFVGWNRQYINQGKYHFAFSHIPYHQLRLPENTFTISCFRDPVQRVLSHYCMLLDWVENDTKHPARKVEGKWLGNDFSDFIDRIPREHLLNQIYMFSANFDTAEALENLRKTSFSFFTESFSDGIERINEMLSIKLSLLKVNRSDRSRLKVPEAQISRLREILEPEYQLLELMRKEGRLNSGSETQI